MNNPTVERRLYIIAGAMAGLVLILLLILMSDKTPAVRPAPQATALEGDVTAFRRDCVFHVLKGGEAPAACRSFEAARESYGVDARFLLQVELGKMIMTARRIARGEILTEDDLKACLKNGECIEIPRIPPKFHDNEKVQNSPQGIKTRAAFWHLVTDGSLTPEICSFMDICRAYYKLGLIHFDGDMDNNPP